MALLIKGLIFVFTLACILLPIYSKTERCTVDGLDLYGHRNRLSHNETYVGVTEEFNTTNVKSAKIENTKYLEAAYENGILKISTTNEILKYEEDESASGTIEAQLVVYCGGDEDADDATKPLNVTYFQKIKDVNTHDPKFEKDQYVFVFNSNLERGFELQDAMKIFASDQDFSTNSLEFDIERNKEVNVQRRYGSTGKTSEMEIYLLEDIEAHFEQQYNITVTMKIPEIFTQKHYRTQFRPTDPYLEYINTDNGTPSRTTSAILTLIVNEYPGENKFEDSKYEVMINNMTLNLKKTITLDNGFDENTKIEIESDYAKYFKAEKNYLHDRIDISVVEEIPKPRASIPSISLKLLAIDNGVTITTEITVKSNDPIAYLCKFDQKDLHEWKGSYNSPASINDTHEGLVEEIITLNVQDLSCESKYFKCDFQNQILKIFTNEEFKKFEENEASTLIKMKIELQCHYEKYTLEYKHTVTDINNHDPEFNLKTYEYIFYDELPSYMHLQDIFPVSIFDMDVTTSSFNVKIEEDNEIWFWDAYPENKTAWPKMELRNSITPPFKKSYILTADDNGRPKKSCEAVLNLEVKLTNSLRFTELIYYAHVKEDKLVFLNNYFGLENGFDNELKLLLRSAYWDYFEIQTDMLRNEIRIVTKKNITEIPNDEVTLTIEATWKGQFARSDVIVLLNGDMPTDTTTSSEISTEEPNFTNTNYSFVNFNNWIFYSTLSQITIFIIAVIYFGIMISVLRKTTIISTLFKVRKVEEEVVEVITTNDFKRLY